MYRPPLMEEARAMRGLDVGPILSTAPTSESRSSREPRFSASTRPA